MYEPRNKLGQNVHKGKKDSGCTKRRSRGFHVKCTLDSKGIKFKNPTYLKKV